MPHLQLHPHVSFVRVEGQTVFLDLRRDRYFALDPSSASAFDQLLANPDGEASEKAASALLASGLFQVSKVPSPLNEFRLADPAKVVPKRPADSHFSDLLRVAFIVMRARWALSTTSLERVIERRHRRRTEGPALPTSATLALTRRFLSVRALVPIQPTCLLDSIALRDWLTGHGAVAELVIGVRLDPFAAHCWVQLGQTVLNDAPDRVSTYTPILVIG